MANRIVAAAVIVLVLSLPFIGAAQQPQVASVYHDIHRISSKFVNEERTVWVRVPLDYTRSKESYPVIYMLDGHAPQTSMMAGIIEQQAWAGTMPEAILVSIQNTARGRDLTPVKDGRPGESGGGDNFLDFLEKEVFPLVESSYRTRPYRIFAGHSLGGLLVVYALATRPHMFSAYIAASPVLHFQDDFVISRTKESFSSQKDLKKTLFVSIGDEPDYKKGFGEFQRLLDKESPKGLESEFREFPEESHGSVVLRAYYWGLRKVYEGWMPERVGSASDLERHYKKLSERYGYPILPPEAAMNAIGYRLLNAGRNIEAIEAFKRNAANYPSSANVYDSLGEAYEKNGQKGKAAENYKKAVELADAAGDSRAGEIYKKNLARVDQE